MIRTDKIQKFIVMQMRIMSAGLIFWCVLTKVWDYVIWLILIVIFYIILMEIIEKCLK
jgi:fatty acid desaturase